MVNSLVDKRKRRWWKYTVFVGVFRVLGYFYILVNPFWGIILSMLLDVVDAYVFGFGRFTTSEYHLMDKPIDYIQEIFAIIVLISTPIFIPYILMLIWRSIGLVIYARSHRRGILMLFPNIGEVFLILYFANLNGYINIELFSLPVVLTILAIKLLQEYFLHIKKSSESLLVNDWVYKLRLKLGFAPVVD